MRDLRKCAKCGQVHLPTSMMSSFLNLRGDVVHVCFACMMKFGELGD